MNDPTGGTLADNLDRLYALSGTDEGFYILALFSWIESYAAAAGVGQSGSEHFSDKLKALLAILSSDGRTPYYPRYSQLMQGYQIANRVRHNFDRISKGEAVAMTNEFIRFCEFIRWHDPRLEKLRQLFSLWDNKIPPAEAHKELLQLRNRLKRLQDENEQFRKSLAEHTLSREELQKARKCLVEQAAALERAEGSARNRQARNDRLRGELHEVREEKKALEQQLAAVSFQEEYLAYIERFTFYTRSRIDYARSLMQLTPEQLSVSRRIQEHGDYLVRGGAGTGKTLVLLHALYDHHKRRLERLDFEPDREVCLLTYTNALVRFNDYLARLLSGQSDSAVITTIDHFLQQRLHMVDERYRIDYRIISESLQPDMAPFLAAKELEAEIETAIFGRALTRDAYLNEPAARMGMKKPLTGKEKQTVWEIAEALSGRMEQSGSFSKNYSRLRLLRLLEAEPSRREALKVRRLYIDEVQDLSPVDIRLLSLLSADGLVMAGDESQSIYQTGFSFRKLGVDIVGHSALLRTNYRNTRQIHHLAALYRAAAVDGREVLESRSSLLETFRDGPVPEFWQTESIGDLMQTLSKRLGFFLKTLQYAPETIAVLAPTKQLAGNLHSRLQAEGLDVVDIRANDFDFEKTPGIRVTTLHSAKGIEFPVVMLFIPEMPVSSRISTEAAEASCRKLLYVAITRCIDNLQIFSLHEPEQVVVREFCALFSRYYQQVHDSKADEPA